MKQTDNTKNKPTYVCDILSNPLGCIALMFSPLSHIILEIEAFLISRSCGAVNPETQPFYLLVLDWKSGTHQFLLSFRTSTYHLL